MKSSSYDHIPLWRPDLAIFPSFYFKRINITKIPEATNVDAVLDSLSSCYEHENISDYEIDDEYIPENNGNFTSSESTDSVV